MSAGFNKIGYFKCLRGMKLKAGAIQVLTILYSYSDQYGGNIHPGVSRLAGDCCMGESTVREHLKLLIDCGLIREEERGGRNWAGRAWASTYRLCVPGSTAEDLDVDDSTAEDLAVDNDSTAEDLAVDNDPQPPDLATQPPDLGHSTAENSAPIKSLSRYLSSREKPSRGEGYVSSAREADPPDQSNIDVHAINGGCGGTGNLSAGVCAISSNGHMPTRIEPSTDLVVADQADDSDDLYLRLGFVPSASERTLNGVTPPSEFCAKHQPSGTEGNCHPCGRARRYRHNQWPYTDPGIQYCTYQAATGELVKQQGRTLGRELQQQAVIEKLSSHPNAAMFGFNPDSAVDRKALEWQLRKDPPGEAIEGEIA
jgi:Helix-turn-helix domain